MAEFQPSGNLSLTFRGKMLAMHCASCLLLIKFSAPQPRQNREVISSKQYQFRLHFHSWKWAWANLMVVWVIVMGFDLSIVGAIIVCASAYDRNDTFIAHVIDFLCSTCICMFCHVFTVDCLRLSNQLTNDAAARKSVEVMGFTPSIDTKFHSMSCFTSFL